MSTRPEVITMPRTPITLPADHAGPSRALADGGEPARLDDDRGVADHPALASTLISQSTCRIRSACWPDIVLLFI